MTAYSVTGDQTTPYTLGNQDSLTVQESGSLTCVGAAITATAAGRQVTILGEVEGNQGFRSALGQHSLNIGFSGSLFANGDAVELTATNATTTTTLTNDGYITSFADRAINSLSESLNITNSGSILGYQEAIFLGSGALTLNNTGVIGSLNNDFDAIRIEGLQADKITNSGTIIGGIYLGQGNDLYSGQFGKVINGTVDLGSGNDEAIGSAGNEYFDGGADKDTLEGGLGDDILYGESGSDTARYSGSIGATVDLRQADQINDPVAQNTGYGFDMLISIENLVGSSAGDVFIGSEAYDNKLEGMGGNDVLQGHFGSDTLDGGEGIDTASYTLATAAVTVNLATGTGVGDHAQGDVLISIENLVGSSFNDSLTGNAQANRFEGGLGADTLAGGAGDDTYVLDATDTVIEAAGGGSDTLLVSFNVALAASAEIETVVANTLNAVSFTGNGFGNTLIGNNGQDTLRGEAGSDVLQGHFGSDGLWGGSGTDQLLGGAGLDLLYGESENDVLSGGEDADRLFGGLGKDTLTGGSGQDIFVFDTKPSKSTNIDRIMDFSVADDGLFLDNAVFKKLGSGSPASPKKLASSKFYAGAKAHDESDRLIYNKKTGALYYDKDGTGSAAQVQIATLSKNLKLTYKDFFII